MCVGVVRDVVLDILDMFVVISVLSGGLGFFSEKRDCKSKNMAPFHGYPPSYLGACGAWLQMTGAYLFIRNHQCIRNLLLPQKKCLSSTTLACNQCIVTMSCGI